MNVQLQKEKSHSITSKPRGVSTLAVAVDRVSAVRALRLRFGVRLYDWILTAGMLSARRANKSRNHLKYAN